MTVACVGAADDHACVRHRQVTGKGRDNSWFISGLGERCCARYVGPGLERPSAGKAMISGIGVGRTVEEVCHLVMNRQKALGLAG